MARNEDDTNPTAIEFGPGFTASPSAQAFSQTAFQQQGGDPGEGGPDPTTVRERDPRLERLYQQLENSGSRTSQLFAQQQASMAPARQRLLDATSRELPAPPQYQDVKPPPQKTAMSKDLSVYMSLMMVVAGIGAMKARTSAITGLTAMAGAMDGLKQGNDEAWKRNVELWKEANNTIIQSNKIKNDSYKAVLENQKLDLDVKVAQLQALAAQHQDQIAYESARRGDLVTLAKLVQSEEVAMAKLAQRAEAMEQRIALALAKAQGGSAAARNAPERGTEWFRQAFGLKPGEPFTPEQQRFMLELSMQGRNPIGTAQGQIPLQVPAPAGAAASQRGPQVGPGSKADPLPPPMTRPWFGTPELDKGQLKPNTWYKTPQGPMLWDGQQFFSG